MLLKSLNFIRGSLTVSVCGAYVERFLNICAANNIAFWNIKRISCDIIYADIHIQSFKMLCEYSRRAMCRVHILKKNGLPFFIRKFRKRYALAAGLVLSVAAMMILSRYVWTVEINGCVGISQTDLMECLNKNGFYIGMKINDVDVDALRNAVMSEQKEVLWMTVNTIGSHAEIFIKEREQTQVMLESEQPADIIASRDGIIAQVSAKNGISQVCVGQTVAKGDLLISGKYQSQITGIKMMHASGDIYARTWYDLKEVIPHPQNCLSRTGNKKNRYSIVFCTKRINLYAKDNAPFEQYQKTMQSKRLYLGKKLCLPISIVTQSFYECETVDVEPYYSAAEKIMLDDLNNNLKTIISDGQVINRSFSVTLENGVYTGTLNAECVENIAYEIPIQNDEEVRTNAPKK